MAKQLNFKAKKLTRVEAEEIAIAISVDEGLKSGLLDKAEKEDFINLLKKLKR